MSKAFQVGGSYIMETFKEAELHFLKGLKGSQVVNCIWSMADT